MRSEGFSAQCTTLERFTSDTPFGVISFCDVLDHMPFPTPVLNRAQPRLLSMARENAYSSVPAAYSVNERSIVGTKVVARR